MRRVVVNVPEDEPLVNVAGEAKDFGELLQKASNLEPGLVLMDVHIRDESKFQPEFIKLELRDSAERIFAMSFFKDDETTERTAAVAVEIGDTTALIVDQSKFAGLQTNDI